jgi:ATP-dependent Clp protease protease subunit
MLTKISTSPGLTYTDENGNTQLNKPKFLIVNDFCEEANNAFLAGINHVVNDPQPFVPIVVDSFGGDVLTVLSMLDMLDAVSKPVVTICTSKAMSCGSVLLSAGTKGYRYASPRATILIHEASTQLEGKASDIISDAKSMEVFNDKMMEILAKNSNRPKKFYQQLIKKANNADLYLTAYQALEYGLIDFVSVPTLEMDIRAEYKLTHGGIPEKKVLKNEKKVLKKSKAKLITSE